MLIPLLFLLLAIGCFAWAGLLLSKRWTELRLLDPLTIKEEQHRTKREAMIRKRFDRMRNERSQPFRRLGRAFARQAESWYEGAVNRLRAIESSYTSTKSPFASIAPTTHERIKTLVTEARSFMRDTKWAEAEKRFLDVLALDPHHVEAYKGLGQIYLKQKLYPQAQETFAFILKMNRADDATYAALADIEEAAGHWHEAELHRLQAVDLGGKQSIRHSEMAQHYIETGELAKAQSAVKHAVDLEPNSAKYVEQALDIAVREGDGDGARAWYQKFRLLSDDRLRFQYWREKVEGLEAQKVDTKAALEEKSVKEASIISDESTKKHRPKKSFPLE
ncbi:tetratricopeptide repeat protein [Patescibacteria group bacterium]|nr:tetratricopeptide repeat protein [Patescibacteria group bacterium]